MTPTRLAGGGLGVVVLAVVVMLLGGDPRTLLDAQQPVGQVGAPASGPVDDDAKKFVAVVLRDTEKVWDKLFADRGLNYEHPVLNLFSQNTRSGCGPASSAMGPFYCPADQQIYLDPTFFDELATRHDAAGDFAHAYVIAHEVGHHIQKLLGYTDKVNQVRRTAGKVESNRASVRLELQADFLAGVWAHHAERRFQILEKGDIEEAVNAAIQIGDDTLQRKARGQVVPEAFTHGTSEQRRRWFVAGLRSGRFDQAVRLFELDYADL